MSLGFEDVLDSIDSFCSAGESGWAHLACSVCFFPSLQLANETILTIFQIVLAVFFLLRNDLQKYLRSDLQFT